MNGYNHACLWRDYVNEWARPEGCRLDNIRSIINIFFRHINPLKTLESTTKQTIQDYINSRWAEGVSNPTIRKELTIYYAACGHAVSRDRIKEFAKIKKPPKGAPRTRFLSSEECEAVMASARADKEAERAVIYALLGLETAARATAIEELTVDRVSLERRVIDFRVPGKVYKNKKRGPVKISDYLYGPLAEHIAKLKPSDFVVPSGPQGGRETSHMWKRVMVRAGINEPFVCRHTLRKTWASHAAKAGVSSKRIGMHLHDKPSTVDESYAFLLIDDMGDTVNFRKDRPAVAPLAE